MSTRVRVEIEGFAPERDTDVLSLSALRLELTRDNKVEQRPPANWSTEDALNTQWRKQKTDQLRNDCRDHLKFKFEPEGAGTLTRSKKVRLLAGYLQQERDKCVRSYKELSEAARASGISPEKAAAYQARLNSQNFADLIEVRLRTAEDDDANAPTPVSTTEKVVVGVGSSLLGLGAGVLVGFLVGGPVGIGLGVAVGGLVAMVAGGIWYIVRCVSSNANEEDSGTDYARGLIEQMNADATANLGERIVVTEQEDGSFHLEVRPAGAAGDDDNNDADEVQPANDHEGDYQANDPLLGGDDNANAGGRNNVAGNANAGDDNNNGGLRHRRQGHPDASVAPTPPPPP